MALIGASTMEVTFSISQNQTAAGSTILYVNAYDKTNRRMAIDFTQINSSQLSASVNNSNSSSIINEYQNNFVIYYQLLVSDNFLTLYNSNSSLFNVKCAYYDTVNNDWSTYG